MMLHGNHIFMLHLRKSINKLLVFEIHKNWGCETIEIAVPLHHRPTQYKTVVTPKGEIKEIIKYLQRLAYIFYK